MSGSSCIALYLNLNSQVQLHVEGSTYLALGSLLEA